MRLNARIGLIGAVALAVVLGSLGWLWWRSADEGSPVASGDDPAPGAPAVGAAQPDGIDPSLLERLRGRLKVTTDAEAWMVQEGLAHAFDCPGLDASAAALASELLPPRPIEGGQRIVRRYADGWEVLNLGDGETGRLSWGPEGCTFERLPPVELTGEVVFDDGEVAAGAVVQACGVTTRTDEEGHFALDVAPDASAVLVDDRLLCQVRVVHPDGFTASPQTWGDGVADVVLDTPTSAVEVELLESRLSTRDREPAGWREEQTLWLQDVVTLGSPPPAVRALLEDRVQTIESASSRSSANALLEDAGYTPDEITELFPDG